MKITIYKEILGFLVMNGITGICFIKLAYSYIYDKITKIEYDKITNLENNIFELNETITYLKNSLAERETLNMELTNKIDTLISANFTVV